MSPAGIRQYAGLDDIKGQETGCVAAVGNFDGIHLGHQEIFARTLAGARKHGGPSLAVTFSVHTIRELNPHKAPESIMTLEERLRIIGTLGIDAALVLPFNGGLASLTPETFVREILIDVLGVAEVVAGEGWRFGKERSGDMDLLRALGNKMGFGVQKVPDLFSGGLSVSSTRIREALGRGDVDQARRLLGRPHLIRNRVVRGHGRGQKLGFPTVNIPSGEVITPSRGVYAASFTCRDSTGPAAVNIGSRPTFGSGPTTVEAHLVGMEGDLYGEEVAIRFLARLRDEISFPDVPSLLEQIARDVEKAKEIYALEKGE